MVPPAARREAIGIIVERHGMRFEDSRDWPSAPSTRARAALSLTGLLPFRLRGAAPSPSRRWRMKAPSGISPAFASSRWRSSKVSRSEKGGGAVFAALGAAMSLRSWRRVLIVAPQAFNA